MVDVNFNLEAFKAGFGDGARSNLFYYVPNFPGGVDEGLGSNARFLVKSTSLPETTITEAIVSWQGFDFKYGAKHEFSDFTVTFNVDIKAKIRTAFEKWVNEKIHDPETNEYFPFDQYMLDQRLQLLGFDGSVIKEYTLHDAWPKMIGAITLDYATTDIATFDVTFVYSYHTISESGTGN